MPRTSYASSRLLHLFSFAAGASSGGGRRRSDHVAARAVGQRRDGASAKVSPSFRIVRWIRLPWTRADAMARPSAFAPSGRRPMAPETTAEDQDADSEAVRANTSFRNSRLDVREDAPDFLIPSW